MEALRVNGFQSRRNQPRHPDSRRTNTKTRTPSGNSTLPGRFCDAFEFLERLSHPSLAMQGRIVLFGDATFLKHKI